MLYTKHAHTSSPHTQQMVASTWLGDVKEAPLIQKFIDTCALSKFHYLIKSAHTNSFNKLGLHMLCYQVILTYLLYSQESPSYLYA